ncbi:MAG: AsmA-like C-terminal region-containing protein, partial [Puniceicoccales bacterium]|nr:AsmA-like C-terminal region-containing protein [Puniceicoccales bacterium]
SFNLNRAESEFTIQKNKIYFPNGKINGPDCNVLAVGNYDFLADRLNFRAMLTVTVGNNIPLFGHVMGMVNRIPRLTPVNITGSIDDPQWSLDPTPSVLWGGSLDSSLGTPPAVRQESGNEKK